MKKLIVTKNTTLTPAMEELIEGKLQKLKSKFIHIDDDMSLTITLEVAKDKHIATIVIAKHKHIFKVCEETEDMYKSIDKAFKTMERELRKHKEKIKASKVRKQQQALNELSQEDLEEYPDEENNDIE